MKTFTPTDLWVRAIQGAFAANGADGIDALKLKVLDYLGDPWAQPRLSLVLPTKAVPNTVLYQAVVWPDSSRILICSNKGATLWCAHSARKIATLDFARRFVVARSAVVWPDGSKVLINAFDGTGRIFIFSAEGHLMGSVRTADATAVAIWPDGSQIATGHFGHSTELRVWDVSKAPWCQRTLARNTGFIFCIAVWPDGLKLATGHPTHAAVWHDLYGHGDKIMLSGHNGEVNQLAIWPDGSRIAGASRNGLVLVWAPDGTRLATIGEEDTDFSVFGLSIWPDGSHLATCGSSVQGSAKKGPTIRIWDSQGYGRVAQFGGFGEHVADVHVFPNMQRMVSAGYDGSAAIWSCGMN